MTEFNSEGVDNILTNERLPGPELIIDLGHLLAHRRMHPLIEVDFIFMDGGASLISHDTKSPLGPGGMVTSGTVAGPDFVVDVPKTDAPSSPEVELEGRLDADTVFLSEFFHRPIPFINNFLATRSAFVFLPTLNNMQ